MVDLQSLLVSLLVWQVFSEPQHGFYAMAKQVQCTAEVCFPLHMAAATAWWQLVHVSRDALTSSALAKQLHSGDTGLCLLSSVAHQQVVAK